MSNPRPLASVLGTIPNSREASSPLAHVFISYSKEDKERVDKLAACLARDGIDTIWIDRNNLRPGVDFDQQIETALNSAVCVLGCWSVNAKHSDYVRDEMSRSHQRGKLIPAALDDTPIMLGLGMLHYARLANWDYESRDNFEYRKLVAEVKLRTSPRSRMAEMNSTDFGQPAKLFTVTQHLTSVLDRIDQDYSFSNRWFEPLQAQVRVRLGDVSQEERIADLHEELRDVAERLTVVLGLPGSGKSVAMREFARQELKRADESGVLPIYLNLRDWVPDRRWSVEAPPQLPELFQFIKTTLVFEGNPGVTAYFADFLALHASGKLLWIFDSFDELPAILDSGIGSAADLIKTVSRLLEDFVCSGGANSRGIIASRFERQPDFPPRHAKQLELQPFSDDRISNAFTRVPGFPRPLINDLFGPPGTLVPLIRTPFYHGLLAEHAVAYRSLPKTTAEMFELHVRRRMAGVTGISASLYSDEIEGTLRFAEDAARLIFESSLSGLSVPTSALRQLFPNEDVDRYLSQLRGSRIVRTGPKPAEMLAFSHRRIHEYFLVRYKVRQFIPFDIEWVAQDRRERDSAVLYVEVADQEVACEIAAKLWDEVKKGTGQGYGSIQFSRSLHCLRFLVEAFRSRLDAIKPFHNELEALVLERLRNSSDIISVKIAVEAIGLLSHEGLERNVLSALRRGDFWIRETAIDACRFLTGLPPTVAGHIWRSAAFLSESDFLRDLQKLKFAFRLSPGLREVEALADARANDIRAWRLWKRWALLLVTNPVFSLCVFLYSRFCQKTYPDWRSVQRRLKGNPILLYISDTRLLATCKAELRGVEDKELEWARAADADRAFGIPRYRAIHASFSAVVLLAGWVGLFLVMLIELSSQWSTLIDYSLSILGVRSEDLSSYVAGGLFTISVMLTVMFIQALTRRRYALIVSGEKGPGTVSEIVKFITILSIWIGVIGLIAGSYFYVTSDGQAKDAKPFDPLISGLYFAVKAILVLFGILTCVSIVWAILLALWNAISVIYAWGRDPRRRARDLKRFQQASVVGQWSRERIDAILQEFETAQWRERFVDWLSKEGILPTGEWPTGQPPNFRDAASTKLAMLEHTWRGFDR